MFKYLKNERSTLDFVKAFGTSNKFIGFALIKSQKSEKTKQNTANGGLDFNRRKTKQNIIALNLAREGPDY